MNRSLISLGSVLAFVAVALGAFGTHGLRARLTPEMLAIWQTGVQYHLTHAVAVILAGLLTAHIDDRRIALAGRLFAVGVLIFSGTLYVYAVTGVKVFAMVTPLGGLAFLVAWGLMALGAARPACPGV